MKKIISLTICLFLLMVFSASGVVRAEFDLTLDSAILVESTTGQILFAKDIDKAMPPASITKIMSILLTMEALERGEVSLDDQVSVSQRAQGMGGSQIFLSTQDHPTMEILLKAVVVASANDACLAIAEYIGGTEDNFVQMMNKRAKELGMNDTHFVNSHGLTEEGHYTTAYDISLMSRELIKYEKFREWAQIWHENVQLTSRQASITNTNSLINHYQDLDGIKTGHTEKAGYCLAASAERDGFRLISVVLNTESPEERNETSARLLDYGFRAFERKVVIKEKETVSDIAIEQGKQKTVEGYVEKSLQVVVMKGTSSELHRKTVFLENKAPISKDEKVGELIVYQGEEELGRVNILAAEDVEKANIFMRLLNWLWSLILRLINGIKNLFT